MAKPDDNLEPNATYEMMVIYGEVIAERLRQNEKWGKQEHDPIEWLGILGEEVGEVNKACIETYFNYEGADSDYSEYRKELIQTAAVCVAMIECLDEKNSEILNQRINPRTTKLIEEQKLTAKS